MMRKLAITALTMTCLASLALAADDKGPLETIMEGIQKKSNALGTATRNAANYKKGAKSIVEDCEEVIKLSKESREIKEPSEKEKRPLAEWQKLTDDMIEATEALAKVAKDPKSTQPQAKEAYTAYRKTCSACHSIYKKDDQ